MDIIWFICGLVFSILGLLGLLGLWAQWDIFYRRKRWPSVEGTIQTSRVKIEDKGKDDNGNNFYLYRPEILYHYQIEEKAYVARDPVYDSVIDRESAEKFVAMYPIGEKINVFYNPKRPQESKLKSDFRIDWSLLVVISILLTAGIWMIFAAFKA